MRYKKVLLVNLAYPGYLGNISTPPTGLGSLAQALQEAEIDYGFLDLGFWSYKQEKKRLFSELKKYSPDLIGISMMTLCYLDHYELLNSIKKEFPGIALLVGGAHISTFREEALKECWAIDFGVVLEGDKTLVELCQGRAFAEIKGLIYRRGEEVVYAGDREFIQDLDSLSWPRYHNFSLKNYSQTMPIVTSRGCPYDCIYCPVRLAIGRKFRMRSAENVIGEMEYWHKKGYRKFDIWDDNFTLVAPRVYKICDIIEKKGWDDIELGVPNGVRADRVNREMLSRMKEVGFTMLSFGVESGSNKVLQNLRKGETVEVIEQAIADACELGYKVFLYFLIGSPGETWNDFQASLSLAQRYPVAEARFYTLIPFPGTELYDWVKEHNYFAVSPNEYLNIVPHFSADPCFTTPEMSKEERIKAFNLGWELTSKQRRIYRARRLNHLGLLGKVITRFTVSDFYHNIFKPSWLRKIFIEPLKNYIFKKKKQNG